MDDTTTKEEDKKFPTVAEEAANNNVDGLAGAPIESEAEESSPETRAAELEAELAEYKDRLLRALAETVRRPCEFGKIAHQFALGGLRSRRPRQGKRTKRRASRRPSPST